MQIAAPCGPQNYEKLHVAEMDRYLDFWNLMAYDYGKARLFRSLECYFDLLRPFSRLLGFCLRTSGQHPWWAHKWHQGRSILPFQGCSTS